MEAKYNLDAGFLAGFNDGEEELVVASINEICGFAVDEIGRLTETDT